ncbi:hypothetical protein HDU67_003298 [Dinochytrium kinnereticum]|nr:hypothetical protein HDU67_003298 [Dinochytrium kinnereticum]
MAKKAKKGGGGAGKGKGKSKRGKKSANPLPSEQANALMSYLLVESKERSMNFYKRWYLQQKELLKKNRDSLHKLEKAEYGYMRNLLDGTEILSVQIDTMAVTRDEAHAALDQSLKSDPGSSNHWSELENLRDLVEKYETEIEKCTEQISGLHMFQASGGPSLQEMEVLKMKEVAQQKAEQREKEIKKIQTKHEASVLATARRAEQVISEIETNANKQGIERMTMARMKIVKRNRKLKELVHVLGSDAEKIKRSVEALEIENINLMRNLYSLDYNLQYERPVEVDELDAVMPQLQMKTVSDAIPRILQEEGLMRQDNLRILGIEGKPWQPRKGHFTSTNNALAEATV